MLCQHVSGNATSIDAKEKALYAQGIYVQK